MSQTFRESGDKEISKLLKVPEDTVASIIRKFKATGSVSMRHGHDVDEGRKCQQSQQDS